MEHRTGRSDLTEGENCVSSVLPASCEKVEGLVQVEVEMTVEMTADKLVYAFLQQSFRLL